MITDGEISCLKTRRNIKSTETILSVLIFELSVITVQLLVSKQELLDKKVQVQKIGQDIWYN